jgi:acetylornithine deacetylase/succinyl-diaminopimelate desuccinylase family protein
MGTKTARAAAIATIESMRDEILSTLSAVVRIPSITPKFPDLDYDELVGGEGRCNAALRPTYEAAGATIDMWAEEPGRDNLVGVVKGSGGGRSLIFNGHIDTVPAGDPAAWKWGDPWSGKIEDGRLYGLGAVDMKAGVVAQGMAAVALKRADIQLNGDVILESVVGEETMDHERGVTATVRRGYRADAAIVTEPTALPYPSSIAPCSAGGGRLIIRVKGKATHATARGSLIWPGGAGETYGVSAIDKAFIVYQALRRLEEEWGFTKRHPLFPPGHASIGVNAILGKPPGPMTPYIIPNECALDIQVLYLPNDSWEAVIAEIETYLNRVYDNDHWLRVNRPTMEWPHHWPPYNTDIDHPICRTIAAAHEAALGVTPLIMGFPAVDDATYLERGGIPSISFGAGNVMMAHAVDEYVVCDEVINACKVYAATAIEWCGVA